MFVRLRPLFASVALLLATTSFAQETTTDAPPASKANNGTAVIDPNVTDDQAESAKQAQPIEETPSEEASVEEKKPEKKEKVKKAQKPKPKKRTKVRYAEFRLNGSLPESPGGSGPFGDLSVDLRKLIARIDRAAEDDTIKGMILRLREADFGRGQQHELREAIKRFRATGKRAVAEVEIVTGGGYLIAVACDEIVMPESGFMMLTGVRAEPLFYKGLLSKIGIKADVVHVGDAKGAGEPYTRRHWSKPVKENLTSLIDDLYQQMLDTIAMDRPMTRAAAVEAIDRGLLTATQAKEAGLIDRIAYSQGLRSYLADQHEVDRAVYVRNYGQEEVDTDFSGPAGFFKLLGLMAGGGKKRGPRGDKIAIVYAVGPIVTGESEVDPFGNSDSVGSTTIVEALEEAASDKRTAAIVLRVNSPGGSAVASDLIWNMIEEIDIPVVASMGDVAASGGYYISMGADRVYAEPTTVTGSIGVVGGKMAIRGLLDKLGITSDLISRGKNSGLFSPMKKFTDSEREVLLSMMEDTYDQFTAKAAAGRGLTQERIKELGGGRVYTGRQAKRLGLIDELGDLRAAIAGAKELAGLDPDEKVRIDTYPEAVDFFESVFGNTEAEQEVRSQIDSSLNHALSLGGALPELRDAVHRLAWLRKVFAHEPVAVLMPFELKVE